MIYFSNPDNQPVNVGDLFRVIEKDPFSHGRLRIKVVREKEGDTIGPEVDRWEVEPDAAELYYALARDEGRDR